MILVWISNKSTLVEILRETEWVLGREHKLQAGDLSYDPRTNFFTASDFRPTSKHKNSKTYLQGTTCQRLPTSLRPEGCRMSQKAPVFTGAFSLQDKSIHQNVTSHRQCILSEENYTQTIIFRNAGAIDVGQVISLMSNSASHLGKGRLQHFGRCCGSSGPPRNRLLSRSRPIHHCSLTWQFSFFY